VRAFLLLFVTACSGGHHEERPVHHPGPVVPTLGGTSHHPHPHLSPHELGEHHHHPHVHPHLAGPAGHHHPY
jgi:hypothetical protein